MRNEENSMDNGAMEKYYLKTKRNESGTIPNSFLLI